MAEDKKALFMEAERRGLFAGKDPSLVAEARRRILGDEGPKDSMLESFARGVGQGATASFQDEGSALVEPYMDKALDFFTGNNIAERDKDKTYATRRDEYRQDNRESQEDNPWSYGLGEVAGSLPSSIAIGGASAAAAKGQPFLKSLVRPALEGATMGGLSAAGASENEGFDLAKDVAKGSALGGVLSAGGAAIGKGIEKGSKFASGLMDDIGGDVKKVASKVDEAATATSQFADDAGDMADELDDFSYDLPEIETPPQLHVDATPEDSRLAQFANYTGKSEDDAARNIAYAKKNAPRIFAEDRVHLDPTKPNNLQKMVWKDFISTKKRMQTLEKETGEILKDVSIDPKAAAKPLKAEIKRITGRYYTPENEGTANVLMDYLQGVKSDNGVSMKGILSGDESIPASELRNFIRDLRSGNVTAYKGGQQLKTQPRALKQVAEQLNDVLKAQLKKQKGAEVAKVFESKMKDYADDTSAFVALKKAWKVGANGPEADTWYDRNVIHKLQKVVDGDRSAGDGLSKALVHIGKKNGNDYLSTVKDNFVLSDMFPDMSSGIDRGTWTRTTGRAANAGLNAVRGNVLQAGKDVAGAVTDNTDTVKRHILKKFLQGQKGASTQAAQAWMNAGDTLKKIPPKIGTVSKMINQGGNIAQTGIQGLGQAAVPPAAKRVVSFPPVDVMNPERKKNEKMQNQDIPIERMGKYTQSLMKAKQRGPQALAAANYVLSNSDPEYREMLKKQREQEGEQ